MEINGGNKSIKAEEQEMQRPGYRNLFRVSEGQQGGWWGLSQKPAGHRAEKEASQVMKWREGQFIGDLRVNAKAVTFVLIRQRATMRF